MADIIDDRLEIGSIIFEKVTDTKPPKDKYYIITGFTSDTTLLSTVYINSDINSNLFPTAVLRALHVPITKEENPFLKRDSFVDCSNIHEKDTNTVLSLIKSNDPRFGYIATVSSVCLGIIMDTLRESHTISGIQKRKYGFI